MNQTVNAHGLSFKKILSEQDIRKRVGELGRQLTERYSSRNPLFLPVLNGAFIFAADLVRACSMHCEVAFIRLSSYDGLSSSGRVQTVFGLQTDIQNRHVILVEDIIDTGKTLHHFIPELQKMGPASVEIATFLVKPDALEWKLDIHYIGFEIPNLFVIGYGLDYNGLGRNLNGIYQLEERPGPEETDP